MKSESFTAVNERKLIQTRDQGRLFGLKKKINRQEKVAAAAAEPDKERLLDELKGYQQEYTNLLEKSVVKTQQIAATIPPVKIPEQLPVAALEDAFIQAISSNQVVIFAGETGCGKTTQLPKLCLKAGLGRRGLIGHTQPRRVAATSVAKRIAVELGSKPGDLVGYSVRFHQDFSENTRILLMTDGILLSELEKDPWLSRYEVVIIDEAHERSLNIDFLLGFLQSLLKKRRDLKVIITSATIDPQSFSDFFGGAPVLLAEGRSYPVEIRYRPLQDAEKGIALDESEGVIQAVEECLSTGPGDILVFANGESEIKQICRDIQHHFPGQLRVLPLYARLGMQAQNKVFAPSQQRKVVVSTNVAETSLTVPGIVFVIDTGTARISRFSQRTKIQQLPIEKISQASAKQRAGRCGRIAPGVCIRLYDEEDFNNREAFTPPEIQRTNLAAVVLRLKILKVKQLEHFPLLQSPSDKAWKAAITQLIELGALDRKQDLTPLGRSMARIPADPQLSRLLVENKHHALQEMLIIAAFMSGREIRERPHEAQQKADQAHAQFLVKGSDVLTVINLWHRLSEKRQNLSSRQFKDWCRENYLNFLTWLEWKNLYQQLKQSVFELGLKENKTPATDEQVHRSLIPGFASHILMRDKEGAYQGARGVKVFLHPSSVCFKAGSQWMLSLEIIETTKAWARMNSPLQSEWIEEALPHLLKDRYFDPHWRKDRGMACTHLDRSLFGLPVVVSRIVSCVDLEPEVARKLFLNPGLAEAQIKTRLPFLLENQKLQQEILQQEQAQRTQGLLLSPDEIAALYEQRIPPHIRTEKSLVRWLKKDWIGRNQRLRFERDELLARPLESDHGFPPCIEVRGVELPVRYRFAPGEPDDGMTVCLPASMVRQFHDEDFEWMVPGLLQEKIQITLKNLKKSLRKQLIPIAESAEKIYSAVIQSEYRSKPYLTTIAFEVRRLLGAPVNESDFAEPDWPSHLRVKFECVGATKKGRPQIVYQLQQLKNTQVISANDERKTVRQLHSDLSWPADGIPLQIEKQKRGQKLRLFQSLRRQADNRFCMLECASMQEAVIWHRQSVAELQAIRLKTELNQFYKGWPEKRQLDKLTIRLKGGRQLIDWLLAAIAWELLNESELPQSGAEYQSFCERVNQVWRQRLTDVLQHLQSLLQQKEQIQLKLASLNHQVYEASKQDIEWQLDSLWKPQQITQNLNWVLTDYTRIHQAIEVRIKRIHENFPKEQAALEDWTEWLAWWKDLLAEKPAFWFATDTARALYRMLENFRMSLFSPGIKVPGGASTTKLQKAFEAAEAERL